MDKEARKEWLKEHNITKDQMKLYYQWLRDDNAVSFSDPFKKLNASQLAEILRLGREKQEHEAADPADDIETYLSRKIESGKDLTERELSEAVEYSIQDIEGEDHRWQKEMTSIIKLGENLYRIKWMRGLTEMQGASFDSQPERVYPVSYEKTILVKEFLTQDEMVLRAREIKNEVIDGLGQPDLTKENRDMEQPAENTQDMDQEMEDMELD